MSGPKRDADQACGGSRAPEKGSRAAEALKASDLAAPGASSGPVQFDEEGLPIVVVPIEEAIDLHSFRPRDVLGVVDAYLDAALERGFREVRLIHGRGKGVQRANIQRSLAQDPRVERYADAPQYRGGWGATLVALRLPEADTDEPVDPPARD